MKLSGTPRDSSPARKNAMRWLLLGLSGATLFFLGTFLEWPLLCLFSKPLPVLALLGWLRSAPGTPLRRWISLGLLCSLLGDVLLAWPQDLFVFGLAAFLCAHLAYLRAFTRDCRRPAWIALFGALLIGASLFALLLRAGLGELLLPVLVYSLTIAAMLWRALARLGEAALARASVWLGATGALLFVLSDSLIGIDRFVTPLPAAPYLILLSYWLGQTAIASVCFADRPSCFSRAD